MSDLIDGVYGTLALSARGIGAAGMKVAIERGWLEMHSSGTYVKFTPVGAELFA